MRTEQRLFGLKEHVDAGHDIRAQWTVYMDASTTVDPDTGTLWVNGDREILDDSDGDTEYWCRTCDREVWNLYGENRQEVDWT